MTTTITTTNSNRNPRHLTQASRRPHEGTNNSFGVDSPPPPTGSLVELRYLQPPHATSVTTPISLLDHLRMVGYVPQLQPAHGAGQNDNARAIAAVLQDALLMVDDLEQEQGWNHELRHHFDHHHQNNDDNNNNAAT